MDISVANKAVINRHKSVVTIGDKKLVSFRYVRGTPFVNIRSYKRDEHGRMFATKRGIMLSLAEWKSLKEDTCEFDKIGIGAPFFLKPKEKQMETSLREVAAADDDVCPSAAATAVLSPSTTKTKRKITMSEVNQTPTPKKKKQKKSIETSGSTVEKNRGSSMKERK